MGIAAVVLGIISLLTSWIPFVSLIALCLAITGFVLGMIDTVRKTRTGGKNGPAITGTVVSALAMVIATYMTFSVGTAILSLF